MSMESLNLPICPDTRRPQATTVGTGILVGLPMKKEPDGGCGPGCGTKLKEFGLICPPGPEAGSATHQTRQLLAVVFTIKPTGGDVNAPGVPSQLRTVEEGESW